MQDDFLHKAHIKGVTHPPGGNISLSRDRFSDLPLTSTHLHTKDFGERISPLVLHLNDLQSQLYPTVMGISLYYTSKGSREWMI